MQIVMRIKLRKGFDVELPGEPEQTVRDGPIVRRSALLGADYRGIRPALAVAAGDTVIAGQTVFCDRRHPELRVVAPVAGRVLAIEMGPRRTLRAIVIDSEDAGQNRASGTTIALPDRHDVDAVRRALLESGHWTALRARPFSTIPSPDVEPQAIVVSLIDTRPWAADPTVVLDGHARQLEAGVDALSRLAPRVFVCKPKAMVVEPFNAANVQIVEISGPHPAGLPGTLIELLAPAHAERETWYVGYQDVVAIGELFASGRLETRRVVSIAGPGIPHPRLVRTQLGAAIDELLGSDADPRASVTVGSPLAGRIPAPETAFLGRYETQIAVTYEPAENRATTADASGEAGMLPIEAFEAVWPLPSPPLVLLRALLAADTETAEALGCLSLDEEDLALCARVCPAHLDYGAALRRVLDELQRTSR